MRAKHLRGGHQSVGQGEALRNEIADKSFEPSGVDRTLVGDVLQ